MKTFKLDPDAFQDIRKKTFIRIIPLSFVAVFAGLYVSYINQSPDSSKIDTFSFTIPVILVVLVYSIVRALNRRKVIWESYQLMIDGNTITRTENNTPTISINKDEIVEISDHANGIILIRSNEQAKFIYVPSAVQDRKELVQSLSEFGTINQVEAKKSNFTVYLYSLLVIGLFLLFYKSEKLPAILFSGSLLTIGLLWSFIEIRRSKHIDNKLKRSSYFVFFLIFVIIGRILFELRIF